MGGKAWVYAEREEKVEGKHCLGEETVPFLEGKIGVARGESNAQMIFECVDHTLGRVTVVGIRGN